MNNAVEFLAQVFDGVLDFTVGIMTVIGLAVVWGAALIGAYYGIAWVLQ